MLAGDSGTPKRLLQISLKPKKTALQILKRSANEQIPANHFSHPEAIHPQNEQGQPIHAFFFPPQNPNFENPPLSLPPLIVHIHGGPTMQAISGFSWGCAIFHFTRICRAHAELSRQQRVWKRIPRVAQRAVGGR